MPNVKDATKRREGAHSPGVEDVSATDPPNVFRRVDQGNWEDEIRRTAREICGSKFIASLKEYRTGPVIFGAAVLWTQVVVAWVIALLAPLPWAALSFVIICACHQGMLMWVHEGSHWTLFRSRKLNDFWVDLWFATPIGMTQAAYRKSHKTHHAHLATEHDMDKWAFDIDVRGRGLLEVLLKSLSCYYGLRVALAKYLKGALGQGKDLSESTSHSNHVEGAQFSRIVMTVAWNLLLLGLCIAAGRWYLYLVLWAYPILAISILLNIVRSIGEHQPPVREHESDLESVWHPTTRTTVPSSLEKWLLYQVNFNYHVEHHLYQSIPFFSLPKIYRRLRDGGFYDRYPEMLQQSGFACFWKLRTSPEAKPVALEGATQ